MNAKVFSAPSSTSESPRQPRDRRQETEFTVLPSPLVKKSIHEGSLHDDHCRRYGWPSDRWIHPFVDASSCNYTLKKPNSLMIYPGGVFSNRFFGVTVTQTINYYQEFVKDNWYIRSAVSALQTTPFV